MTRQVALNTLKGGINRLRIKASPEPTSLYDLVNGYVTQAGTVESRPGTVTHALLPTGTKGLCVFEDKFHVFSDSAKVVPAGYVCEILIHPSPPVGGATLERIHFAKPFLGALYVVAEWSDDPDIAYHYWLQELDTWEANTVYARGALVQPTVPNGYAYRASRLGEAPPPWAPGVARAVDDMVSEVGGGAYDHKVIEVAGANPRSGTTEPDWTQSDGGITYEDADNAPAPPPPPPPGPPPVPPGYGNPGGSTPGNFPPTQQQ